MYARSAPPAQPPLAASPARPPLAVPLAALAGFGLLLVLTIGGWAPLDDWDARVSEWFRGYGDQRPDLVAVIRIGTDVAATVPFLIAGLLVSLALAGRRDFRPAFLCAAVTVAVPLLWGLMHWALHHPRPADGFVLVQSNGFPSGHTSNAAAAALVAVLLLWPRCGRAGRAVTVGLAVAFALAVGLTRLALLVHWPADVLGGWLLALVVVPLAARTAHRVVPARISDRSADPRVPAG
ncbi:phosphatase PAP2 family protein [Solwaraspora sp. WMMD1047]|uniref:phosphatase PAP2 family protein n=1 Tax=Solwaraspora sp. WMMD1047 TaxID=3016102 RepID=UPI002416064F|nr:phosphatase PAP2 family protein [Solwaraspora sp. WMMD1047]MDG4832466.1 phosphatase PAP2 family protein [Solwaraspora sp. WMMD1047]